MSDVVPARYFRWSPWLSRILGMALLLPALPIIGVCVIVIRLTSKGPGIFRQTRVGLHGRPYIMYKLRTMRCGAEKESGPVWTQPDDERITRLGHFLRLLHLDEFPQLFNVVRGEMALIGPRPERPEFVQRLMREIPGYLDRLFVLPGITGLSQINLPPDTTTDCVRRKLVLDLEYVERGGLFTDVRICLCTFARLFGLRGELPARLLGLHYRPVLDSDSSPPSPAPDPPSANGKPVRRVNGHGIHTPSSNGSSSNGSSGNGKAKDVTTPHHGDEVVASRWDRGPMRD